MLRGRGHHILALTTADLHGQRIVVPPLPLHIVPGEHEPFARVETPLRQRDIGEDVLIGIVVERPLQPRIEPRGTPHERKNLATVKRIVRRTAVAGFLQIPVLLSHTAQSTPTQPRNGQRAHAQAKPPTAPPHSIAREYRHNALRRATFVRRASRLEGGGRCLSATVEQKPACSPGDTPTTDLCSIVFECYTINAHI